jgi:hypothetical protein
VILFKSGAFNELDIQVGTTLTAKQLLSVIEPLPTERVGVEFEAMSGSLMFFEKKLSGLSAGQSRRPDDSAIGWFDHDRRVLAFREALADFKGLARPFADRPNWPDDVGFCERSASIFAAADFRRVLVVESYEYDPSATDARSDSDRDIFSSLVHAYVRRGVLASLRTFNCCIDFVAVRANQANHSVNDHFGGVGTVNETMAIVILPHSRGF